MASLWAGQVASPRRTTPRALGPPLAGGLAPPTCEAAGALTMTGMAGIAEGSEWIQVTRLREILDQLPADAMVMASPLGNLVVYDQAGPIDGQQIAYIDLLTETISHDTEPAPASRTD